MDERFYVIYRQLYERYRFVNSLRFPPSYDLWEGAEGGSPTLIVAEEFVERVAVELGPGYTLRPDARLFLLTTVHQMIAVPLAQSTSPTRLDESVIAALGDDAREVARATAEAAERRDRRDVAASHVLWGIADVLDKLKLKDWRIWERS